MIASADCYVSLHRSEGFGLTPAEAMCMGKPVIATRYGGNLEFMNDRNSWLVDCELVPIGPGQGALSRDGEWADPDVEQAAGYMREIFAEPSARATARAQGARDMRGGILPRAAGRLNASDVWSTSTPAANARAETCRRALHARSQQAGGARLAWSATARALAIGFAQGFHPPPGAASDQAVHGLSGDGGH